MIRTTLHILLQKIQLSNRVHERWKGDLGFIQNPTLSLTIANKKKKRVELSNFAHLHQPKWSACPKEEQSPAIQLCISPRRD